MFLTALLQSIFMYAVIINMCMLISPSDIAMPPAGLCFADVNFFY